MAVWSKNDLKAIWDWYQKNIIYYLYPNNELDLFQESYCYLCDELVLKSQYLGWQSGKYPWNVDHFDGNPSNNYLGNLFITHPECNRWKANRSINEMLNFDDFYQKYRILRNRGIVN